MNSPTLVVTPLRPAVSSAGGPLEVLVRVQAPAAPAEPTRQRAPLRLALVIDRSGSMDGQPLEEAMRCARHVVERLHEKDSVAVVLYDDQVRVPVPLQGMRHRDEILGRLHGVHSGGSTALFDGWEQGAKLLGRQERAGVALRSTPAYERKEAAAVSRVILLSDGQANRGLVEVSEIEAHCARWAARGVTTTTVGLGRHFNEDLMVAMARAGGGQQYYGQTAEDLLDGFAEEFELLQSLFLRRLRLRPTAAEGVIVETATSLQQIEQGWVALSDLAWGSESWVMLRLHVAPQPASGGAARALLAGTLQAVGEDDTVLQFALLMLSLPVVSPEAFAAMPQDELVVRRLLELQFADESMRVRSLILKGEMAQAKKALKAFESQVATHPWLAEKLKALQALAESDPAMASKEMRYSQRLANRLAPVSESLYSADETGADDVPMFLRRKESEGKGRKS